MKHKNDISVMFQSEMSLYENQSTDNPNMPLRGFWYFADIYRKLIKNDFRIYGTKLIKIPTPQYYVFYTGRDRAEDTWELKLSDSFEVPVKTGLFEWTATVINLNSEHNTLLKGRSNTLGEYCAFIDKVRSLKTEMTLVDAIDQAVDYCIKNNILKDVLSQNRAEVRNMLFTEFDEKAYEEFIRNESREEGRAEGKLDLAKQTAVRLRERGLSDEEIAEIIDVSVDIIKTWK